MAAWTQLSIQAQVGRLNPDGSLDGTFTPDANGVVRCMLLQTDGKIVVGGDFTSLSGQPRNHIGRLNPDGGLDLTYNPTANASVNAMALHGDGRILISGYFTTVAERPRNYIARLNNTGPATESLTFDGENIIWLRGGTSPEVWIAIFDASTNGSDWVGLGPGHRIPGGWRLSGVSLATNSTIRARGLVAAGGTRSFVSFGGVSSWFVETIGGPFAFANRPTVSISRNGRLPLLSVAGDVGSSYVLEFVPALTVSDSWQPLTVLSLTNSPQYYLDSSADGVTQRFYRARLSQ